ncbi:liver carboxylesterase B-1-like [Tropilaelaps mercedesae]|uniref:Liver carboxylesterase B-1-like n=1 Tax=Tropilaelaps mercedesae TaxID=418985 RepID=A0A1V9XFK1_9ACAR|nr:liver carboxylesterase B-1-like [Tropilaelaps mercedesae]
MQATVGLKHGPICRLGLHQHSDAHMVNRLCHRSRERSTTFTTPRRRLARRFTRPSHSDLRGPPFKLLSLPRLQRTAGPPFQQTVVFFATARIRRSCPVRVTLRMLVATAILALARSQTPTVLLNGQAVWGRLEVFPHTNALVEAFLGIAYATPPVGQLRFRAPVPLSAGGAKPMNATSFAPGCVAEFGMFTTETRRFSEDCLYLNIWRPRNTKAGDRKAVVVVIHGGAYSAGDGSEKNWRGVALAAVGDIIVVNFNYRLGVFGFLDLDSPAAPGHQGHRDQHMVLRWVHDNISAFGGDPERVTLFGVGAGSFSISAHLLSPLSAERNLFHAAVMDAGVLTSYHAEPASASAERASRMALAANCAGVAESPTKAEKVLECLKNLSPSKLVDLQQAFGLSQTHTFRPTYPNEFLGSLRDLSDVTADDFSVRVPAIVGDSSKEGTSLITERVHESFPKLHNVRDTLWQMRNITKWHGFEGRFTDDDLVKTYGLVDNLERSFYLNASAYFAGDVLFVCPVNKFVRLYSPSAMVYQYFWTRTTATPTAGPDSWMFGAYHGIPFYHMMGSFFERFAPYELLPEDVAYSMDAIDMVSEFAKTGKQPSFRGVTLPSYDVNEQQVFIFSDYPERVKGHPRQAVCDAVWPYGTAAQKDEL